jgi:hypothetical protein
VKQPDMLGTAQWSVMRNSKITKVDILHKSWVEAYHARLVLVHPGDSLKCSFEEVVTYDAAGNEIERKLFVIEVLAVVSPPVQTKLDF